MARTVAEYLVDTLASTGARRIYGIVGDSLNPVTDALRRNGAIQWVDVRHEETAAFAAGAEAQLTGQLAVCAGSCGPGNLHLINGLYDAHRSMAPVLAIAAHIPSTEVGTDYFQETHPDQLFRECSHYCELISNPRQAPRVVQSAIQHAVSRRGVSVIVLPGDVAAEDAPGDASAHGPFAARPVVRPADQDLARLAELVNGAQRVAMFCGIGCAGAHDEVVALAEKLQAPVGYSFRGKEWVEHDNPCAVGMSGLLGWGAAYKAMHECDVLLLLGTDFPYESFMPTSPKIAQIDLRHERLGRRCKLDVGLCGDIHDTIQALLPLLEHKSDRAFLDTMLSITPSPATSFARTWITSADGGRSTPSTSPLRWMNWLTMMRCSPWIRGCAPSGAHATCMLRSAGEFLARSTTAPWPTRCPRPSARRQRIPTGR